MHFLPISYADFRAYFPSLSLPGWKAFKIPGDGLTIGWETIWHTPTARITTSIPPYSDQLHQQTHYELSFAAQGDAA